MFEILKADFAVNYYNFVNLGKFRCFGTVLAHSICYNITPHTKVKTRWKR